MATTQDLVDRMLLVAGAITKLVEDKQKLVAENATLTAAQHTPSPQEQAAIDDAVLKIDQALEAANK